MRNQITADAAILRRQIAEGDLEGVRRTVAEGRADVTFEFGMRPLDLVRRQVEELVRPTAPDWDRTADMLYGAMFTALAASGQGPASTAYPNALFLAWRDDQVLQRLESGDDASAVCRQANGSRVGVLTNAAAFATPDTLRALIAAGAPLLGAADESDPVLRAVAALNRDAASFLVEAGLTVQPGVQDALIDAVGMVAAHPQLGGRFTAVIRWLGRQGVALDPDDDGVSLLSCAAEQGSAAAVRALLAAGASPHATDPRSDHTPAELAEKCGTADVRDMFRAFEARAAAMTLTRARPAIRH